MPTGNCKCRGMKASLAVLALVAAAGAVAHAGDVPEPTTNTQAQAQARQFGIFFGGTASQYDLCAKKGFLPKGNQSAEEIAKSFLEKTWAVNSAADESVYVQDGWDKMKREISENESFYTQQRCAAVGKQWTKLLEGMRKK
jgi:hypothetical protein